MRLRVGEIVVYGGHCPGRVIARKTGTTDAVFQEVVVLEFAATLMVTLPLPLAREQLRPLATKQELDGVKQTLRASPPVEEPLWLRRQKATRAKLAEGEPMGLAEVVSAGALRLQGNGGRLSVSERDLYLKARRLLAAEIGHIRGIEPTQAEGGITAQLVEADYYPGSSGQGLPAD